MFNSFKPKDKGAMPSSDAIQKSFSPFLGAAQPVPNIDFGLTPEAEAPKPTDMGHTSPQPAARVLEPSVAKIPDLFEEQLQPLSPLPVEEGIETVHPWDEPLPPWPEVGQPVTTFDEPLSLGGERPLSDMLPEALSSFSPDTAILDDDDELSLDEETISEWDMAAAMDEISQEVADPFSLPLNKNSAEASTPLPPFEITSTNTNADIFSQSAGSTGMPPVPTQTTLGDLSIPTSIDEEYSEHQSMTGLYVAPGFDDEPMVSTLEPMQDVYTPVSLDEDISVLDLDEAQPNTFDWVTPSSEAGPLQTENQAYDTPPFEQSFDTSTVDSVDVVTADAFDITLFQSEPELTVENLSQPSVDLFEISGLDVSTPSPVDPTLSFDSDFQPEFSVNEVVNDFSLMLPDETEPLAPIVLPPEQTLSITPDVEPIDESLDWSDLGSGDEPLVMPLDETVVEPPGFTEEHPIDKEDLKWDDSSVLTPDEGTVVIPSLSPESEAWQVERPEALYPTDTEMVDIHTQAEDLGMVLTDMPAVPLEEEQPKQVFSAVISNEEAVLPPLTHPTGQPAIEKALIEGAENFEVLRSLDLQENARLFLVKMDDLYAVMAEFLPLYAEDSVVEVLTVFNDPSGTSYETAPFHAYVEEGKAAGQQQFQIKLGRWTGYLSMSSEGLELVADSLDGA